MTNLALVVDNTEVNTMTSLEIAELTNKTHTNVMRDIREVLEQLYSDNSDLISQFSDTYQGTRRKEKCYKLPRRECEILVTGYDIVRRAAVIDRWFELETKQKPVQLSQDEQLMQLAQGVIRLTQERDHAIKTKAQISDRKTATAMATASNLSRKVKKLEAQLQDVGSHMSLLAAHLPDHVETELKPKVQTWRLLKMLSGEMNLPTQEVADPRFGKVKTYHINVINEFKARYL